MKRMLPVLAALILAALIPAYALAEGNESVTISIGTASAEANAQVDVPVYLKNCAQVDSIQFDLNYDPAALSVVSVTPGDLFLAEYVVYNADEPGRIRIACADALGLKGDGTLLTIRFTALTAAGSALTATSGIITRVDADYQQTSAYVSLGDGGVSSGAGAVPAARVTPWIPETPPPTPTPEPTASPVPEPDALALPVDSGLPETPAPSAADSAVDPISYVAVAVLFLILIGLIVVSTLKHRRQAAASSLDHPVRKDS